MKKINWKILNTAFWMELTLSYILPFHVVDNFQYRIGFPVAFLSIYDTKMGVSPLLSMHFNPLTFLADGVSIYLVLLGCVKIYQKIVK